MKQAKSFKPVAGDKKYPFLEGIVLKSKDHSTKKTQYCNTVDSKQGS